MASSVDAQTRGDSQSRRLDSWKEIAAHLRRGERTVRRWEQAEGLPVHRHLHEKGASVYAYASELDEWVQTRTAKIQTDPAPDAPRSRLRRSAIVFGILIAIGIVTAVLLSRPSADVELVAVPLTTYPGDELDPSFSPDGSQIAFSWNGPSHDNFDIYVKTVGQENALRLTRDPAHEFNPVWSPDGRFIAFLRESGGDQVALILVSPVGGAEVTLAKFYHRPFPRTRFYTRYLSWHPSGKYLITAGSDAGDTPFALQIVSLSGEVRKVTTPDVAWTGDLNPAYSPDGKAVAFIRLNNCLFGGQIYTLALSPDGKVIGEPRAVSWAGTNAVSAAWTRDGRELVYRQTGEHGFQRTGVFERRTPRRLKLQLTGIENPAISPDGHSLVFSVGHTDVDIARSDIAAPVHEPHSERVISSTRTDTESRQSPDGRRLVFASERSGAQEIWIAGVDGTGSRQLTNLNVLSGQPSWSPDGKWIAFDSRPRGGHARIYVVPPDQPRITQITSGSTDDFVPRWSRDGRWLYFGSDRTGRDEIWKASVSDFSDQRQVTSHGGVGAIESPDGQYLYYVKQAGLIGPAHLWRLRTATGEEEAMIQSWNINWWDFVPTNDGVYFTDTPQTNAGRFLYFYDIGTGEVRRAASLPKSYFCCLDVSNDGRYAYYSVVDDLGHDLMIVQNFH
jgi:Tol biopolymer transport system component